MKLNIVYVTALVLFCFMQTSEEFGVPFFGTECGAYTFDNAMEQLEKMDPIKAVYLDFDKTITVNDYSFIVRNGYCQMEYPNCTHFNATDVMVNFLRCIIRLE